MNRQATLAGSPIFIYNMFGTRFEKEFSMIDKALKSEKAEKEFRLYVKPYLELVVNEYISENKITNFQKEDLMKAGWTHFTIALKKYFERAEMMKEKQNELYYFNTYFNWYIRQAIIEYINSKK